MGSWTGSSIGRSARRLGASLDTPAGHPNAVTLAGLVLGVIAASQFWYATPHSAMLGVLLFFLQVEDRRYVVCLNEDQRRKEAADREAIVGALRDQLSRGDKSLIGNKGYRKYHKTQGERFAIDEQKISEEARYDGKWVLRTNIVLPTAEVALKYKQLWMVEEIFRSAKSLLETRPSSTSAMTPSGATCSVPF